PPMLREIGTVPAEMPAGTTAFTWERPGKPGASPLNRMVAGWPPMVTAGSTFVCVSTVDEANSPLAGPPFTGPSPFMYNVTTWPRFTGLAAVTMALFWSRATAMPEFSMNAGAVSASGTVTTVPYEYPYSGTLTSAEGCAS